jgi:hypothetical protein
MARSPPMSPDMKGMENTAARVIINHLLAGSISLSEDRLAVSRTSFQFVKEDIVSLPDDKFPEKSTRWHRNYKKIIWMGIILIAKG